MSGGAKEKSLAAFDAMKALGIPWVKVAPVLMRLLKDNENNWELIEDANYHLLADQIFEAREKKIEEFYSSLNPVKKKRKLGVLEEWQVSGRANLKATVAILAMIELGLHKDEIMPMLKRLLKDNKDNWELIEEANYHLLADQIFEAQEKEIEAKKKKAGNSSSDSSRSQKKRVGHESSSFLNPRKKLKLDERAQGMGSASSRKKVIAAIRAIKELGIAAHEAAQELKRLYKDSDNH